jgi:crotonobetainyl-CoA:carnitine CoA-transferase CaiB-like acyl-CoA transferase
MTAAPSGAFRTADGLLNVAANKQEQFVALCACIGRPDLATDPRFAERETRKANRAALTAEIEMAFGAAAAAEWEARLNAVGVPAGRVLTVAQALAEPQVQGRDFATTFADRGGALAGPLTVVRGGFLVDGEAPRPSGPPPALGADTEAALREAGAR